MVLFLFSILFLFNIKVELYLDFWVKSVRLIEWEEELRVYVVEESVN